ncbi:MAG TPA: FmdB family zinc ribbon protein [Chloroflexia bacterium]
MPVYEYACKNCGQRFEKIQPVMADPLTECMLCGQGPIRRVLHPVGVIFKGSGWYVTDNRSSGKSSGSSSSKSDDNSKSESASTDKPKAESGSGDSTSSTTASSSSSDE